MYIPAERRSWDVPASKPHRRHTRLWSKMRSCWQVQLGLAQGVLTCSVLSRDTRIPTAPSAPQRQELSWKMAKSRMQPALILCFPDAPGVCHQPPFSKELTHSPFMKLHQLLKVSHLPSCLFYPAQIPCDTTPATASRSWGEQEMETAGLVKLISTGLVTLYTTYSTYKG